MRHDLSIALAVAALTAILGRFLRVKTKLSIVEISAWLTLVAGLILPRVFTQGDLFAGIATAVSYIAMSGKDRINSYLSMLVTSIICALLLYFGQNILVGIGGRLGTSAAISVFVFLGIKHLAGFQGENKTSK